MDSETDIQQVVGSEEEYGTTSTASYKNASSNSKNNTKNSSKDKSNNAMFMVKDKLCLLM